MMRVLAVSHMYPPHHLGGYEVACRGVMERFAEQGHDVMVLTSETRLPGVDDTADATPSPTPSSTVEVRRQLVPWWDWAASTPLQPTRRRRTAIERRNQGALRGAVEEFEPDVASVWSMGFLSFSVLRLLEDRRVPIVLSLCDDWICHAHQFDAWTSSFAVPRATGRPARAGVPSAASLGLAVRRAVAGARGLRSELPTLAGARASYASRMIAAEVSRRGRWQFPNAPVIPLGVETRDFPVTAPPGRPWSWRILYVGRVVRAKGVPTLIRALPKLPAEASLEIDGHALDIDRREMAELAGALGVGDRVTFTRSPRTALRDRYRAADVVVFPSEWAEPFGIVPLEAMACGIPVVATGTGGSGEFLADGTNCVRFTPGDPDDLAAALCRLARDDALRRRVVAGGSDTAALMTMDVYARRLEELHAEAASAPDRGPAAGSGAVSGPSGTSGPSGGPGRGPAARGPQPGPKAEPKASSRAWATGSAP
jgi:glycosyltransferase involved in cell wall biosynthesis